MGKTLSALPRWAGKGHTLPEKYRARKGIGLGLAVRMGNRDEGRRRDLLRGLREKPLPAGKGWSLS
jgi:hypothetical protein